MEPIRISSRYGYHPENSEILPLGDHPPLSARDPEARSIVHAVHQVQNLEEQFTQFINSIHIDAAPVRERLTQLIEEYISTT